MPNYVANILSAPQHVIEALITEKDDMKFVDFNNVIPCPSHDDPIFTAERTEYKGGWVGWSFEGYSPMNWATDHWGTKWNAIGSKFPDEYSVTFETAWCPPMPVINELSKRFSDNEIRFAHADEDHGAYIGMYIIKNGEVLKEYVPDNFTDEAMELASQIRFQKSYAEVKKEWELDEE